MCTVADKSQTLLHPTLRKIGNTEERSNAGGGSGLRMRFSVKGGTAERGGEEGGISYLPGCQ